MRFWGFGDPAYYNTFAAVLRFDVFRFLFGPAARLWPLRNSRIILSLAANQKLTTKSENCSISLTESENTRHVKTAVLNSTGCYLVLEEALSWNFISLEVLSSWKELFRFSSTEFCSFPGWKLALAGFLKFLSSWNFLAFFNSCQFPQFFHSSFLGLFNSLSFQFSQFSGLVFSVSSVLRFFQFLQFLRFSWPFQFCVLLDFLGFFNYLRSFYVRSMLWLHSLPTLRLSCGSAGIRAGEQSVRELSKNPPHQLGHSVASVSSIMSKIFSVSSILSSIFSVSLILCL